MKQVIFSLIEAECHDQQFDVNHLQSSLKVSNAYLWEMSHAHFGLPPRELIESVRLEKVFTISEVVIILLLSGRNVGLGVLEHSKELLKKG